MHNIVHSNAPNYLIELLPNNVNSKSEYNLRNKYHISTIKTRTEKYKKSFFPDTVKLYNNLDESLKCKNKKEFRHTTFNKVLPNPLFYYGKRKTNIIHAQIRMKCSNLNSHLFNLHVIDNPACFCSNKIEDSGHYFIECPMYFTQRLKLKELISSFCDFNLDVILYGCKALHLEINQIIFSGVHNFILETGRFNISNCPTNQV